MVSNQDPTTMKKQFLCAVQSFQLLSCETRKKEYDLGGRAWGESQKYASGAGSEWKADYNWDPRMQYAYPRYGFGSGSTSDAYTGGMNAGPIYMKNGRFAGLVVGVAAVAVVCVMIAFVQQHKRLVGSLDEKDAQLRAYLERKEKVARQEGGFRKAIERLKKLEELPWPQTPSKIATRPEGHVDLDYAGKLILAPMVRCGTLPMRMLALQEGADIVYSPETIDRRLARSKRIENVVSNSIDFIDLDDGTLNLRVHSEEKSKLVIQIGSADPKTAVQAALAVAKDCSGIDLNCGCPKKFSIQGAMGAALLSAPDRLCGILTALVENVPLPITAKIRMLETPEETIQLVQRIEKTGVSAIALHCRFRSERPSDPGHWDIFETIAKSIRIPLIANGDIYTLEDVENLKKIAPSVSSFMLARGPESNWSTFNATPKTPTQSIIGYAKAAIEYDMIFHNCKYVLMQMWPASQKRGKRAQLKGKLNSIANDDEDPVLPPIAQLARSKSYKDLAVIIPGLAEAIEKFEAERLARSEALGRADLLRKDLEAELGPECPYLPTEEVMKQVKRNSTGVVVDEIDFGERKKMKESVE
ncbi:hypothetical protein HDU98_003213 [Podochytrium sp. JEL0797]|nr:hypothetical protein HDU98_003213 [Podochytrium sp. JEL0797]